MTVYREQIKRVTKVEVTPRLHRTCGHVATKKITLIALTLTESYWNLKSILVDSPSSQKLVLKGFTIVLNGSKKSQRLCEWWRETEDRINDCNDRNGLSVILGHSQGSLTHCKGILRRS